jgi:hypothetical protein
MKHLVGEKMIPLVALAAIVYIAATNYAGLDARWAWFSFPLLFTALLWRSGRAVLGLTCASYLFGYVTLVGFGAVSGNRGLLAALLPALCLLVEVFLLTVYWLVEHIKHGT